MANGKIYQKSIFAKYFDSDSANVVAWADNVLAKLIASGAIPDSIKRVGQDGLNTDFEDLYGPVCTFYSYLVQLARHFESFTQDTFLANEYLFQKGSYTCGDEDLDELIYLIENRLRDRSARGTVRMIESSSNINGELLRSICWKTDDYFKLGVAQPQYNSWNLNNSCPIGGGNTGRYDLNSAWEYEEEIQDLTKYPLINDSYVSIGQYRGKDCIHIENVPFGQIAGVGAIDLTKKIVVDPNLDFEITFNIAQDVTLENITFGCIAFDADNNQVDLLDCVTDLSRQWFFETRRLNQPGVFYQVRGIIYNISKSPLSIEDGKLNVGFGRNLKFTSTVASIIPYIICDNNFSDDSFNDSDNFDSDSFSADMGASDPADSWSDPIYDNQPSIYIYNIKVTPCSFALRRYYMNNKNFIDIIIVNRNGHYSVDQINSIFRKYFIPYNSPFQIIEISSGTGLPVARYLLLEDGGYLLLEDGGRIQLES